MSIISSRKSMGSSILKTSTPNRESSLNSIRKSKQLRFQIENLGTVKDVLKDVENNENSKAYQDLVYKLSHEDLSDEELEKTINETIECVQMIKKEYILFLETLLSIRWIKRDKKVISLFQELILNLLTAKSEFLILCLSKVLCCFIPSEDEFEFWKNGEPSHEMSDKLDMMHSLLKKLIEVIPMIPASLKKKVRHEFPYFKQSGIKISAYIFNILKILDYCPVITYDIFVLIFENLTSIDGNISRQEIEDAEENCVFQIGENVDENTMVHPVAETLDVCMDIFFKYLHSKLEVNSITPIEQQKLIQDSLFQYFSESIIKTHNSKHVHFVYFYISSFRKQFLNEFLNILKSKILDMNKMPIIRQYAIGYLSSLLARAKFIPLKTLKSYLQQLCNFVHAYINSCNTNNNSPKAHSIFHAACQAIFYIIAFRHRDLDLMNSPQNVKFLMELNLLRIVKHPLNPLFYCLPAIVTIFDSVMSRHQIIYCHTYIYRNASQKLATVYMTNENHNPEDIIESGFPFDPYLLKKSGMKIHPIYIEYQSADEQEPSISSIQSRKRTRNESESCDYVIIPVKKNRMN